MDFFYFWNLKWTSLLESVSLITVSIQDGFLKKISEILRITIFLVLSMFELLQHQRDEFTEKHVQKNHVRNIDTKNRSTGITKERTLVLQVSFQKAECK